MPATCAPNAQPGPRPRPPGPRPSSTRDAVQGTQHRLVVLALGVLGTLGAPGATAFAQEAPPTEPTYRLELSLDPATGGLQGSGEVALLHSGVTPLESVPFWLYPERFEELDPRITDVNFGRYYAFRFHPGGITATFEGARAPIPAPELGPHVVLVPLDPPVPPGEVARVRFRWTTRVPERFGPFGRRGERVLVEGGAWPLVPARRPDGRFDPALGPALARHELTVSSQSGDLVVRDGSALVGERLAAVVRGRSVFIAAGTDLGVSASAPAAPGAGIPAISFRGPADDVERAQKILGFVRDAAGAFARDFVLPAAGTTPSSGTAPVGSRARALLDEPLVVVLAPLRDRLVHATDVLLASDRLFEIFPFFSAFHEREVARGTFEVLARRALERAGEGNDAGWLAEAIGWLAVEEWDARRQGLKGKEIRSFLGTFDFIKFIDTQLRAPQFASSDLFFGNLHEPRDSVRDELERGASPRVRGRVLAEKLRDRIGTERLLALVRDALAPDARGDARPSFRERAGRAAGEDLTGFFDLWLGRSPVVNLAIDARESVTLLSGEDGLALTVRRDTEDPRLASVGDPVTVRVHSGGQDEDRAWDGKGDRITLVFPRRSLLYSVTVDPDGKIEQGYRGDDIFPGLAKVLVNRFSFSIDLNGGNRSSVDVGMTIHPLYDYAHAVRVDGFYSLAERGGRLGYTYNFGTSINEVRFGHGISGAVTYESLGRGLLRGAKQAVVETKGRQAVYSIGYGFDTRVTGLQPTSGVSGGIGLDTAAGPDFGGDFRYRNLHGGLTVVLTPFRPITFALSAQSGQLFGSNPPSQALYDVGGEDGVRGVRTGDFVDRASFVAKAEVRATVADDLDVNLFYLAWWRRLEVAGFFDTGDVAPHVESLFRAPSEWKRGAGLGLRLELDALGIRPILFRFDVAWQVEGRFDTRPQFYLGGSQSF